MSMYSKANSAWSYIKPTIKLEPFDETSLRECTLDQIRAKIEFLEENIFSLKCECEALELYSIKLRPDFFHTNVIDVSWMPYDYKNMKRKIQNLVNQVPKVLKDFKRRQSAISAKPAGSMYSVVKQTAMIKKITTNHMIFVLGKVLMILDADFDKYYSKLLYQREQITNEIENIEIDHHKILQQIEDYRLEVLVAGLDPLTKRISGEKYEKFIKKRLIANETMLSDYKLKFSDVIKEKRLLKVTIMTTKDILDKVSETDGIQARLNNKRLKRELVETNKKNKKVNVHRSKLRMDFLAKKYRIEKYVLNLDLQSLDADIEYFKNKILPQIQEIPEENDANLNQYELESEKMLKNI